MTEIPKNVYVVSGTANPQLAEQIADEMGVTLGQVKHEKFSNGEIYARYAECVRGTDMYIIQSVAGENVNDALMELLIMVDAARRADVASVTAVLAHYGYARQDRKAASREPITARLVANLLEAAGVDRVVTIDLHQGQIQGFFNIPVSNLTALPIFADYYRSKGFPKEKLCIVSPDVGRAKAAKKFSDMMEADLAIMHKGRPGHNKAEITALIGDVAGKICLINDDMIDTAGSACAAAETLKNKGAEAVYMCSTHPVLSGPAYERIANSCIEELVVCNTIAVPEERQVGKIKVVSVAPLLARAIENLAKNESVSSLFGQDCAL